VVLRGGQFLMSEVPLYLGEAVDTTADLLAALPSEHLPMKSRTEKGDTCFQSKNYFAEM